MNKQETFWAGTFGREYVDRNQEFDQELLLAGWREMLRTVESPPDTILECGSNIGRNLIALKDIYPQAKLALIEINPHSYQIAVETIKPWQSENCSIMNSSFDPDSFDLVFTGGVLIHIAPYNLYRNLEKIFSYSRKYILISEYFARELEIIPYHGHRDKCFKMDYGKFFLENFPVSLIDYGFLYSQKYEAAGFDDTTWWLFLKK